jgi:type I restriction enzyme S subunit
MNLKKCLAERYPHESDEGRAIREHTTKACKKYIKLNPNDKEVEKRLCSENENTYWQQLSEVLLADKLSKAGIQITRETSGPDFLIEHEGKRIWIEVITPEANGILDEWINYDSRNDHAVMRPNNAIILRWTSAIKEKSDKLKKYLRNGLVINGDIYVIAVNGRLLRGWGGVFPNLCGDSQFPFAVEATFCLGALGISIDS